jgi:hypothetical protein
MGLTAKLNGFGGQTQRVWNRNARYLGDDSKKERKD